MRRPSATALAWTFVLASALSSCRQIAGIQTRRPAAQVCSACAEESCARETDACRAAPACATRLTCIEACDLFDDDCAAACSAAQAPAAFTELAAALQCRATRCAEACAPRCGEVTPLAPASQARKCTECTAKQCCAEATACGASVACRAAVECVGARDTPDGALACVQTRFAGSAVPYDALETCVRVGCADECAYGNDWTCVGRVPQPAPEADVIRVALRVSDALSSTRPVVGLRGKLCTFTDTSCRQPLATGVTDENGRIVFTASTVLSTVRSGRSALLAFAELEDPLGAVVPQIMFPGLAMSETDTERRILAITREALVELLRVSGETYDPARGIVLFSTLDCNGRRAGGVSVTAEVAGAVRGARYIRGVLFDPSATATDRQSASGFVMGVPEGLGALVARLPDGGEAARVPFFGRPGWISQVLAPPTPSR